MILLAIDTYKIRRYARAGRVRDVKTVLVTGSAGFIGSNLVQHLEEQGDYRLRLQVHRRPPKSEWAKRGHEIVHGSVLDRKAMESWVQGADIVVHAAADTDVAMATKDPERSLDINCRATMCLLDEVRDADIDRFVYISSARIYGRVQYLPIDERHPYFVEDPYGASKLTGGLYADLYHRLYRVPTVNLVVFSVYGPGQTPKGATGVVAIFCRKVVDGEDIVIYGDGGFQRDLVHVRDVCRAVDLAMEVPEAVGETFNIGTANGTSIGTLADMIIRIASDLGFPRVRTVYKEALEGDVSNCADISKARKVLGYQPKVRLEDGIREYLLWYAAQRKAIAVA